MKLIYLLIFFFTRGILLGQNNPVEVQTLPSSTMPDAILKASGLKTRTNLALSAAQSPDNTTLLQLLKASGLTEQASGKGPYTVFAPNNGAFSALSEPSLSELLLPSSKNQLINLLAYHVVKGRLTSGSCQYSGKMFQITGHGW